MLSRAVFGYVFVGWALSTALSVHVTVPGRDLDY
ncbi:MAG: hypothetical protein JWR32_1373 [Mycobacterium sp.]|jgi:hypothetical protein|nr:hypothetical protein [Mycobacterium sp.]